MATPTGDSYTCDSGATLYAGMNAPPQTINLTGASATQANTSSTGAISIPSGEEPLWLQGVAINEWVEITGSAMSNTPPTVDPGRDSGGPSAKLDTWCGLAIDTRTSTVWSLANGGHDDYHGNEVMKIVLSTDSPAWIEAKPSNSAAEFDIPNDAGYYSNGAPVSCHSYYSQHFIEARDRAIRFTCQAAASTGNSFKNSDGFNIDTNEWDAPGTYPDFPVSVASGMPACKNPTTEDIFLFDSNNSVRKWTQSTNTWSQVNDGFPPIDAGECANAYDTQRNRIFLLKGEGGGQCHTFNPADGTFTAQTLSGDTTAIDAATKGLGMVYVPVLDAYLVRLRAAGGAVYSINAETFEVSTISTTGGSSIPLTANVSGTPENVYGKFLYASQYSGIFYFPHYSANAWFIKVH